MYYSKPNQCATAFLRQWFYVPWTLANSSCWPWAQAPKVKAKPCNSWAMWLFCSSLFGICSWLGAAVVGNPNGVCIHGTYVSSVGPFWIREGHVPQDCVKFITLCAFSCSQLSPSKSHTQRLSSVRKTSHALVVHYLDFDRRYGLCSSTKGYTCF